MNKQGEVGIMAFLIVFIGIITALVLFQGLSPFLSTLRDTATASNVTYTLPNSTTTDLTGQELLSTPTVTNSTDVMGPISAGNYTIDEGVSATTGLKTIQFTWAAASEDAGQTPMNLTYDYGADGYLDNSAGRSIVGLISIFAALAIAVIALSPTLRSDVIGKLGGIGGR